ncbi:hypothetical protein Zmor_001478 [Zophobas morio]|uniref:Uncharacterized protein n=1 Tax=Zophobas morio TaxID=2755281 RepID=A0AA38MPB2_9CUCU|nr:hypothetical protein Zmor_001478 [Zophobas morio]
MIKNCQSQHQEDQNLSVMAVVLLATTDGTAQNAKKKQDVKTNFFEFSRLSLEHELSCDAPILPLEVKGAKGIRPADSGSKWNIAGHTLYKVLQDKGVKFETMDAVVTLADEIPRDKKLLVTNVDVKIKDKITPTSLVIMPYLTQNHTLLGREFLKKANFGIDFQNECCFFRDKPEHTFKYGIKTNSVNINLITLRQNEAQKIKDTAKDEINTLLQKNNTIFEQGGETTFATHRINTQNAVPISVPPYPLNGPKKQFLREELNRLIAQGIIEECESSWSSPVVLTPKETPIVFA